MISADELMKMKKAVENAKSEYDKAIGQLEAIKKQLKDAGFSSITELNAKIDELQKEYDDGTADLEKQVAEFKEKYGELLCKR